MPHVVLYVTPDPQQAPLLQRRIADVGAVPRVGDRVEVPLAPAYGSGAHGEVASVTWSDSLEVAGVLLVVPPASVKQGAYDKAPKGWSKA